MRFYLSFPIHDHTGDPLSEEEASAAQGDWQTQMEGID